MNLISNRPYKIIWNTIPLILFISILNLNGSIDIQLHDTYIVIASIHVGLLLSLMLGVIGLLYWLFRRRKFKIWMTKLHVYTTILSFVLMLLIGIALSRVLEFEISIFKFFNKIFILSLAVVLFGQIILVINLIQSFFSVGDGSDRD